MSVDSPANGQWLDPADPNRHGSFATRSALITGASQGLGLATAALMKARGAAEIMLVGRDPNKGERARAGLDGDGCRAVFVSADLATDDGVATVAAAAERELTTVHAFVNCAAATWRGTVWNTTPAMWDSMLAMNVKTPGLLVSAMAQIMKRDGVAGAMVLVGSVAHHGGNEVLWPYATAKHALEAMVRGAAWSLLSERIRVNLLNPGWMDTPAEHETQKRFHDAPEDWLAQAEAAQPFGRLLKPAEVARGICFLASDESGMMTGTSTDFDQTILGVGDRQSPSPVPEHFPWQEQQ